MSESKALFNFDFNKKIETPRSILEEQSDILFEQSSGKVKFFIVEEKNMDKAWNSINTDFKIRFGVQSEINIYKLEIATFYFNISGFPCFVYSTFATEEDIFFNGTSIDAEDENNLEIYIQKLYDNHLLTCKNSLDFKKVLIHILSNEQIVRTVEVLAQV